MVAEGARQTHVRGTGLPSAEVIDLEQALP